MDADQRREALSGFKRYVVAHPNLVDTVATVNGSIMEPAGAAVTMLYGPTGVGKSTVVRAVMTEANRELMPELAADPGKFGVIKLDAPAPTGGSFSWKQFFIKLLVALGEPIADARLERPGRAVGQRLRSGEEARSQAEQALAQRRPKAVLIDEATHIANLVSGERLLNQLDLLKSLADSTGTHFVLVGTYDLLAFRNLSGQLGRRTQDVHFQRYLPNEGDMGKFQTVVRSFGRALPVDAVDLTEHFEFLYERSLGCVGMLRDWLTRALNSALALERPFLSADLLRANALPMGALMAAAEEISYGEAKLADAERDQLRLRELLGIAPSQGAAALEPAAPRLRAGVTGRVGTRQPSRDPVGVET
ncbi:MAG TPA: ATP-binding protein [Candidatus Limnocylindrales bacterium]|nr:ATP-binding protein [Candidatus Limnocylindrales bacterium]